MSMNLTTILTRQSNSECCLVDASPKLKKEIREELERFRKNATIGLVANALNVREPAPLGKDDGVIFPPNYFPEGTSPQRMRSMAAERAPLRGNVRVVVVLVDFPDRAMGQNQQHFQDLFFSTGILPNGSVKEYYTEVTNGLVTITGEVVGPYRLPKTLEEYAHGESGVGSALPNAQTMARDAAEAANPTVDFSLYDNDGNGFVDAFIIVHAGPGAEETGSKSDIWSHKWVLSSGEYNADGTKIYAYLTVPEDSKIGVCCHELGHLLFGFPDLYDTDYTSEGIGNWCLMAGGSWNGDGEIPSHPSAWCKANQGWVSVVNQTTNGTVTIPDVGTNHKIYRLWKNGAPSSEYFLVENRQLTGYDRKLPGDGLLIWHIDEAIDSNSNENHPKVALMQADGLRHLENAANRGDKSDPYPGNSGNTSFTHTSNPGSKSYAGTATQVAVTDISPSGHSMTASVSVSRGRNPHKELKDVTRPQLGTELVPQQTAVEQVPFPGSPLMAATMGNGSSSDEQAEIDFSLYVRLHPALHPQMQQAKSES